MKRNDHNNKFRTLNPFRNIRFGVSPVKSDDEFADSLDIRTSVRPEGLRWFCGMHDLDTHHMTQVL